MAHSCTQLGSQDITRFRALMAVFASAFEDADAYQGAPPSDAYLQRLLSKPTVIALAAEAEGAVVGGLVAYVLEKFERERSEYWCGHCHRLTETTKTAQEWFSSHA